MFWKLAMFLSSGKCPTMPLHEDVNGIRHQNILLKFGWRWLHDWVVLNVMYHDHNSAVNYSVKWSLLRLLKQIAPVHKVNY